MLLPSGHWGFDFNGYTRIESFTEAIEHVNRDRLAGWWCDLNALRNTLKCDFEDICKREHHRMLVYIAYDPPNRTDAYLRQFGPPPGTNGVERETPVEIARPGFLVSSV